MLCLVQKSGIVWTFNTNDTKPLGRVLLLHLTDKPGTCNLPWKSDFYDLHLIWHNTGSGPSGHNRPHLIKAFNQSLKKKKKNTVTFLWLGEPRVQCQSQGHLHMWKQRSADRDTNHVISRWPSLHPNNSRPNHHSTQLAISQNKYQIAICSNSSHWLFGQLPKYLLPLNIQ